MLERQIVNVEASNPIADVKSLPAIVVLCAVLLTSGFLVLTLSILAGLQLGNTLLRPSPFIPYEAIWPGQSLESLETYARRLPDKQMTCTSGTSPSPNEPYQSAAVYVIPGDVVPQARVICSHQPRAGLFRTITVRVEYGRIQQLELISDVLPEDMLLLYWGMPDSISRLGSDHRLNLFWERSSYSAMATVMESTSLVRIVTLTARI